MSQPELTSSPGSLLAWLIFRVTGERGHADCNCDRRRRAMDRWGWRGCWKRRHAIVAWVVEEARHRGHEVSSGMVASLLVAAVAEVRRRKSRA
jgi:hypothetical protein